MALVKCPECQHDMSDQATTCPNCGHPRAGGGRPVAGFGMPAALQPQSAARSRFRAERQGRAGSFLPEDVCPRCGGRGRIRDKNLLPWNNMGVFVLVLGIAGLAGSAYLELDFRALLILGVALAGLGVGLYVVGEACPLCEGVSRRGTSAKRGNQPAAAPPPVEILEVKAAEPRSSPIMRSGSPARSAQRSPRNTDTRRRTDRRARAEQDRR